MANHAKRTYVVGVRSALERCGIQDASPANIVKLRNSFGDTVPSESAIQMQFGQRFEPWKRRTSDAMVIVLNKALKSKSQPELNSDSILSFDSVIDRIGSIVGALESRNNSSTNVRVDIGVLANITEEAVDNAVHRRLLPYSVCVDLVHAVREYAGNNAYPVQIDEGAIIRLSEAHLYLPPLPGRVKPPNEHMRRSQGERKVPALLPDTEVRMSILRRFENPKK